MSFILIINTMNKIESSIVPKEMVEFINEFPPRHPQSVCIDGKSHVFLDENGAWLRSRFGGLTWQIRCSKCVLQYDTGDSWD